MMMTTTAMGNDDNDDNNDDDGDDDKDDDNDEHHPLICLHQQSDGASGEQWWWAPWPSPPLDPQRSILDDILLNRYSKSLFICVFVVCAPTKTRRNPQIHKTPSKNKCSRLFVRVFAYLSTS
jgi:hypothetical protein